MAALRRPTLLAYVFRRKTLLALVVIVLILITPLTLLRSSRSAAGRPKSSASRAKLRPKAKPQAKSLQELRLSTGLPGQAGELPKLHLLLTATADVRLCKTLLTASVLGYPTPTLIAHDESFVNDDLVGGGRFLSKISGVLEWLDEQPTSAAGDLVLVLDTYGAFNYFDDKAAVNGHLSGDVWFQLRPETMLRRFLAVNARADQDLAVQLGQALKTEKISQSILFGAGKRCAPNSADDTACFAIPESPLPRDMYGPNTDTILGETAYSSYRPRYLNSGYVMGPVAEMRQLFRRAQDKALVLQNKPVPLDAAGRLHRGSDQAIFQEIWGEQELQREAMRRKHAARSDQGSLVDRGTSQAAGHAKAGGAQQAHDLPDPSFAREPAQAKAGKPDEFGIGVDYWSDLGHQMADAPSDGRYVVYGRSVASQAAQRRTHDCTPLASGVVPRDILNTTLPRAAISDASQFSPLRGWDEVALYTDVCLDTIPVLVQANDVATARDAWPRLWMQPFARRLVEEVLARGAGSAGGGGGGGGVLLPGGKRLGWREVCGADVEGELFREGEL